MCGCVLTAHAAMHAENHKAEEEEEEEKGEASSRCSETHADGISDRNRRSSAHAARVIVASTVSLICLETRKPSETIIESSPRAQFDSFV